MSHPSRQELLEHAGRLTDIRRAAEIDIHLRNCDRCRGAFRAMEAVEGALHRLPPEHPSAGVTRNLLSRIGIREATPLWWLFARNFAPILAAGIVTMVVLSLGGGGGAEPSAGRSLFDAGIVRDAVGGAVDAFTAWFGGIAAKYLAFRIGNDAMSVMLFVAGLFAAIGVLDRFVLQRLMRRRH